MHGGPLSERGRFVVIGATGYTGRLVARELARGATAGRAVILAGRDRVAVDALVAEVGGRAQPAEVDVKNRASLAGLIRAGDSVINCAGPFAELGEPVVARCVEARASYVDTTGEQPWMREMRQRYHEPARAAAVPIVNGMAFEWALGDCAAALLALRLGQELRTLDVVYAWGGTASSRGTRRTSLRIIGTRAWELESSRWRRRPAAAARRRFRFTSGRARAAVSFGAGEVVTVPRWAADVATVRGWIVMSDRNARLATIFSPALPVIVPLIRPFLEPLATRRADPTPAERAASPFTIRLEAASADGRTAAAEVRGTDPYGLTAAIAAAGAKRALEPDRPAGVLAPSQLVDPRALLDGLAHRGLELVSER
ncbi:MAG TPA: saccharopine dehydrogenase NADP-binding domain-containing protein [Longimicrobiales bacterium]|nr:saccharopine dehydrogenase NADP-binding domain-containing protein [Longimicrobiales bacterium]